MLHLILTWLVRRGGTLSHISSNTGMSSGIKLPIFYMFGMWGVWGSRARPTSVSPVLIVRLLLRTAWIAPLTESNKAWQSCRRAAVCGYNYAVYLIINDVERSATLKFIQPKTQPDRLSNLLPLSSLMNTFYRILKDTYCTYTRNRWVVSRRRRFVWHV